MTDEELQDLLDNQIILNASNFTRLYLMEEDLLLLPIDESAELDLSEKLKNIGVGKRKDILDKLSSAQNLSTKKP
ncbi:MAG TPA: hypothetical protein PKD55_01855 [Bellilinea sp.]|nr:hypothetical protein [Bellilinea sp.]